MLLAPFAPHISEELWRELGHEDSVFAQEWPSYDEVYLKDDEVEIAVQINGKARTTITIGADDAKDAVIAKAKEALGDKLNGTVVKEIYVPGRIVKRDNVKMPRSDMDQCHLPDPVKEDINVLQRENAELVNRVLDLEQAVRILSADAQKTK